MAICGRAESAVATQQVITRILTLLDLVSQDQGLVERYGTDGIGNKQTFLFRGQLAQQYYDYKDKDNEPGKGFHRYAMRNDRNGSVVWHTL